MALICWSVLLLENSAMWGTDIAYASTDSLAYSVPIQHDAAGTIVLQRVVEYPALNNSIVHLYNEEFRVQPPAVQSILDVNEITDNETQPEEIQTEEQGGETSAGVEAAQQETAETQQSTQENVQQPIQQTQYSITTPSASLWSAYPGDGGYIGRIYCDRVGLNCGLYYGNDASTCNAKDSTCVLDSGWGTGIGDTRGMSILADHNYQTGYIWGWMQVGDCIYVETTYGQFIYEVVGAEYGEAYSNMEYYMYSSGLSLVPDYFNAGGPYPGGILFYTCYPFNASSTSQRYFVWCKLVSGTALS